MKRICPKNILAGVLAILTAAAVTVYKKQPTVQETFIPVRRPEYKLILDAGHGGEDGGAVSVTGVAESGINLAVVLKMDQLLGFYGVSPVLLRETDVSLHDPSAETLRQKKVSDLKNRVAAIEATESSVVISIHQNTFPNAAYHGAQVFYREGEESRALAELTQTALRTGLDPENKRSPALIPDSVYLMKHITCPAILVECGFLSNGREEEKLRSGGYQTQLALSMVSAWLRWSGKSEIGGSQTQDRVV